MEIAYRTQFGALLHYFNLKGDAVEIGVAEGRNAQQIVSWDAVEKLYLIDAWQHLEQRGDGRSPQLWHDTNFNEAHRRVEQYKDKVVWLKGLSREMIKHIPDDSLVFVYIDGDHSYEGAFTDLHNIYPKLKSGGILAGHDYLNHNYGVHDAVTDFMEDHGYSKDDIHITTEDGDTNMSSFWFIKR